MSILSTRERATLIWGIIFFIYVLVRNKEIRKCILEILKLVFKKKMRIIWEIIFLYVLVITVIFYHLSIWNNIYIKDIIIWFLFSGLIYCINTVSSKADEAYIKKILKDNLRFTMILEFFMNTFTLNIWIELVIIPVISIIIIMNLILERQEEYESVYKFTNVLLNIFNLWIIYETIKIGINEYKNLNFENTFVSFMIPIVYLILIIPLEYALAVLSKYDGLFLRMSFKEKNDKKIKMFHRIKIFSVCRFSVRKILLFQRKYMVKMYVNMSDDAFKKLILEFKNEYSRYMN